MSRLRMCFRFDEFESWANQEHYKHLLSKQSSCGIGQRIETSRRNEILHERRVNRYEQTTIPHWILSMLKLKNTDAKLRKAGFKFGKWTNTIQICEWWSMQKMRMKSLGEPPGTQAQQIGNILENAFFQNSSSNPCGSGGQTKADFIQPCRIKLRDNNRSNRKQMERLG